MYGHGGIRDSHFQWTESMWGPHGARSPGCCGLYSCLFSMHCFFYLWNKAASNARVASGRSWRHSSVWKKMGEQWGPLGVPLQWRSRWGHLQCLLDQLCKRSSFGTIWGPIHVFLHVRHWKYICHGDDTTWEKWAAMTCRIQYSLIGALWAPRGSVLDKNGAQRCPIESAKCVRLRKREKD